MDVSRFGPYLDLLPLVFISFVMGIVLTPILRHIGLKYGFATKPKGESVKLGERGEDTRIHKRTTSRLGELAMLLPLFILVWFNLEVGIKSGGILFAMFIIAVFGVIDSKYHLNEFIKLGALTISGVLLFVTGTFLDINSIISLGRFDVTFYHPVVGYEVSIFSFLITILWFYIIPFAVSNVGGVDGLAEGTSAIAILILLLVGIRNGDDITIIIGAICFGGLLGLIPYNFHPAVIFSEHLIYGFIIAILAVTSSTKIATSVLLLTVPILDTIYLFYIRTKKYQRERDKSKPFSVIKMLSYWGTGDKNHFHHKLLNLGNTPVRISLIMYTLYGLLGILALVVTGLFLTLAILLSLFFVVIIFVVVNFLVNKKLNQMSDNRD